MPTGIWRSTYWLTGQPQQAIATLETALKNGVTQREVRIKLGQYMTEAGQARRAIDLLATFANDDPDALIALGNAYVAAGRPADAIRTFTRLLTIDPANALAYQNIGIAELWRTKRGRSRDGTSARRQPRSLAAGRAHRAWRRPRRQQPA